MEKGKETVHYYNVECRFFTEYLLPANNGFVDNAYRVKSCYGYILNEDHEKVYTDICGSDLIAVVPVITFKYAMEDTRVVQTHILQVHTGPLTSRTPTDAEKYGDLFNQ